MNESGVSGIENTQCFAVHGYGITDVTSVSDDIHFPTPSLPRALK